MKIKHFIILISVFVIATVASATYVFFSNNEEEFYTPAEINIPKNDFTDIETEVDINSNDELNKEIETEQTNVENKPLEFIMPVNSTEFGMEFSNGQLIHSKTLNEWCTHNGLDIIEKVGTPVFAVEDGIVTEIVSTSNEGIKISIEHRFGYTSVYSNLSTTKMVNLNDEVKKGQVISGIGKTAAFEYQEPEHLHFEMYKDGLLINPTEVINFNF